MRLVEVSPGLSVEVTGEKITIDSADAICSHCDQMYRDGSPVMFTYGAELLHAECVGPRLHSTTTGLVDDLFAGGEQWP